MKIIDIKKKKMETAKLPLYSLNKVLQAIKDKDPDTELNRPHILSMVKICLSVFPGL